MPNLLQVVIKQSKTDPFRRGVTIHLGATDTVICPVKVMVSYLALRDGQPLLHKMAMASSEEYSAHNWTPY